MSSDPDPSAALPSLIAAVPVAMLLVDEQGIIRQANNEVEALFGWGPHELVGAAVEILVPGPLRQRHVEQRATFASAPRKRAMGSRSRLEARHRDGHLFTVDVMLAPHDERHVLAVVVDRSELRVAEDSLRRSTATFRHVMESIQDIVYVVRAEGGNPLAARVELLSDHVERVVGWTADEFLNDAELWASCIHPDDMAELGRATTEMFKTRQPVVRTYRLRHKHSGEWRLMEDRASLLADARGYPNGYCGVARDITDQRAREAQVLMTERLAALGLLSAGMTHELSNPLTYVLASVDQAALGLRDRPEEVARARELLDDALEGIGRMREILADLSMTNAGSAESSLVDVRRAADQATRIASATVGERATLTREYAEVALIRGSETRLLQVFLNLLLNAAHAIPSERSGNIAIKIAQNDADVVVEVVDDGVGISSEVLPRVFDAFYTTKPPGVGTGLGLYVCRTLVREMGGDIQVESELGKGTQVRVVLPSGVV